MNFKWWTSAWVFSCSKHDLDNRQFWRPVDSLLGCGHTAAKSLINVVSFNQVFTEKKNIIVRASANGEPSLTLTQVRSGISSRTFKPMLSTNAASWLPEKCSAADPNTKRIAPVDAPFITALFNRFLETGCFSRKHSLNQFWRNGLDSVDLGS